MSRPRPSDLADLVRLPAVLSVPGDVLVGAAAAGWPFGVRRALGAATASCCLYLAGMALNDYADRDVDAVERPQRPIPSGRVSPATALALGASLTAAGVGLAAAAHGRRGLGVALPLAVTVWGYDLAVKNGAAGPAAMATARALNVLMGAGTSGARAALPAAAVVAGHTGLITTVSRKEVQGADAQLGVLALGGTASVAAGACAVALSPRPPLRRVLAVMALLGGYAGVQGQAAMAIRRAPTPANLQRFVGSGVLGFMPLDAAVLAARGPAAAVAAVAGAWPLARRLARRRSPT